MTFLAYGEWYDVFNIADEATSLYYDNFYRCNWKSIIVDLERHCEHIGKRQGGVFKNKCKIGDIFINLFEKHVVDTIGSISIITDESYELTMDTDPTTMYETMHSYGKNIGMMIANAVLMWG